MALLPINTNTTKFVAMEQDTRQLDKIPESYQKKNEEARGYLGMSGIGGECMRALWYGFHFVSKTTINRRTLRIFERGDWEEQRIIKDLSEIGLEFFIRVDGIKVPITGAVNEKQEEVVGFAGHAKGHIDGRCIGVIEAPVTEHLAEFKTANGKNWALFDKKGCKDASPVYFAQQQRYLKALNLKRSLFVVTNKDNEKRHIERIKYDAGIADELCRKEQEIILSDKPLEKIGGPNWFGCKFCNHHEVCHGRKEVRKNCRTCEYADMVDEGKWTCENPKLWDGRVKVLSTKDQVDGCDKWEKGWGL